MRFFKRLIPKWTAHRKYLTKVSKAMFPCNEGKLPPLDKRFTYCLDTGLIIILQSYLKLYVEEAERMISLDFHTFTVSGESRTQREWIEEVIKLCDRLNSEDDKRYSPEFRRELHRAFTILEEIMPSLWW